MQVFKLGGTGSIVGELVKRSHHVVGLSHSENSDEKLMATGAQPMRGDLLSRPRWTAQ
jgi:uncharacterized protein YbjT (DUF2867 family)